MITNETKIEKIQIIVKEEINHGDKETVFITWSFS